MKAPMIPDRYHKEITENIKPVMARASRSCPNGVESTSEMPALVVLLNIMC